MTAITRRTALKLMTASGLALAVHPRALAAAPVYPTTLNEFETDFAAAALSIDILWGGDINDPTGINHAIVDAYTSGKKQPDLGPPDLVRLFLQQGFEADDKTAVQAFIKYNQIENRLERILTYAERQKDIWRKSYLKNLVNVFKVQLNLRKSLAGLSKPVPAEECYQTAFGQAPALIDFAEKKDRLQQRLSAVGIGTARSLSLGERVGKWTQRSLLDATDLEKKWDPFSRAMINLTRQRIFPYLPKYVTSIPEDIIDFAILRENVGFSGLNLAKHTIDRNGNPVFKTIVRMSSAVSRAETDYQWNLVAHESWPGHGLHLPLTHLLYAQKKYGFETTLFILNSAPCLLAEGIASATAYLLFGPDMESHLSPDELTAVAVSDLALAGRNNVVVRFIQGEKNPAKLPQFLYDGYAVPLSDAARLCRWLAHPLFGVMYLPAYGIGAEMIQQAVKKYGREKVIPVAYGTRGQIDGISFPDCLAQSVEHFTAPL